MVIRFKNNEAKRKMKNIIIEILRKVAYFCLNYMYNYLDKNKNGALDKDEIEKTLKELKLFLSKYKK
jgi:hypothetical protein